MPRGAGDVSRSFVVVVFSLEMDDADVDVANTFDGDDCRGIAGVDVAIFCIAGVEGTEKGAIAVASAGVTDAALVVCGFDVDASGGDEDVTNSVGFIRGVACTLVISFARSQ